MSNDIKSTTARNLALVSKETGAQAQTISPSQVRKLVKVEPIPVNQEKQLEKTDAIDKVIDSLCSS